MSALLRSTLCSSGAVLLRGSMPNQRELPNQGQNRHTGVNDSRICDEISECAILATWHPTFFRDHSKLRFDSEFELILHVSLAEPVFSCCRLEFRTFACLFAILLSSVAVVGGCLDVVVQLCVAIHRTRARCGLCTAFRVVVIALLSEELN